MKSQKLLQRFGIVLYTGDRIGDLQMMKDELLELYRQGLIEREEYQEGVTEIRQKQQQWET